MVNGECWRMSISTPRRILVLALALSGGCGRDPDPAAPGVGEGTTPVDTESTLADTGPRDRSRLVIVTLDGAPIEGALVVQPGTDRSWSTGADGTVEVLVDTWVDGELALAASHPEARIRGDEFDADELSEPLVVELARFDTTDNLNYHFQDPGVPGEADNTNYCLHCHVTMGEDWYFSPHASAAKNPVVQDLYAGAAAAWSDEATCLEQGGQWWEGLSPGTATSGFRCYLGAGALPALNADCGDSSPCDGVATATGGCAACHAPAIDGVLAGRDLLEATGFAYEAGVHCDLCHKVEAVDEDSVSPGVEGRLNVLRPIEESPSLGLGEFYPLTFGPYADVLNPKMGSVERELFHDGTLCAGCHEHRQPVLAVGAEIDLARWPDGLLPIHSTWSEWQASPMGAGVGCPSCHMPSDPDVGNTIDLGNILEEPKPDIASGWYRPPGAVRRHVWFGPRSDEQRMLDLAATIELSLEREAESVVATVEVKNVGPGHALPTGEPLRTLLLSLEATCDGVPLAAIGGDAIPDFGGYADRRTAEDGWETWPGAEVGDRIRVISRTGVWYDYDGAGSFGDGSFTAEQKGMPEEQVVGEAEVIAVDGDQVSLSAALPEGDLAYRVVDPGGIPADGAPAADLAGAPGFGFAKVLVGPDGSRMVPHFLAVDVASDNRLLPSATWTSAHSFAPCTGEVALTAALIYRRLPRALAEERGWSLTDARFATVRRTLAP